MWAMAPDGKNGPGCSAASPREGSVLSGLPEARVTDPLLQSQKAVESDVLAPLGSQLPLYFKDRMQICVLYTCSVEARSTHLTHFMP